MNDGLIDYYNFNLYLKHVFCIFIIDIRMPLKDKSILELV